MSVKVLLEEAEMFGRNRYKPLYADHVELKFSVKDISTGKDLATLELKAERISDDCLTRRMCEAIETFAISRE
jgi:hypothetical protein